MVFIACGLNHKTAPLDLREKIALSSTKENQLLHSLSELSAINEAAILSTCNRTEIYCDTDDPMSLVPWLAQEHQLSTDNLTPYIYLHHGHHGIRHTLRVASGLDSMMLGEPQILGQMKQAYQQACEVGTVKKNLRQVFEYIFSASKRIRSRSGIGSNPISIAYAAVQLIGKMFQNYKGLRVFLIGSGETASLVAKYLHKEGVENFLVASRTHQNAMELAAAFQGKALTIGDIPQYLAEADVIISATTCPLPFINKGLVEHALGRRNQAPMFLLDLAVPRDIEPEVGHLAGVELYNIDDLQGMIDKGMHQRRLAASQAELLIETELDNFLRSHRIQRATEAICNYRNHMQKLAEQELKRSKSKLRQGVDQELVLEELCDRLLNKLAHTPTAGFKQAALDDRSELLELARYLFNSPDALYSYEEIA